MYVELAENARGVIGAHIAELCQQIEQIVSDGVASGAFVVDDPIATARGIFYATNHFHNPAHARSWLEPDIDQAFEDVWSLILWGLGVRQKP